MKFQEKTELGTSEELHDIISLIEIIPNNFTLVVYPQDVILNYVALDLIGIKIEISSTSRICNNPFTLTHECVQYCEKEYCYNRNKILETERMLPWKNGNTQYM